MSSKLYSKPGVFAWSPTKIEEKGLVIGDFAQFFDPTASSIDQKIEFLSSQDVLKNLQPVPTVSTSIKYRFNELAWSNLVSETHPSGIIGGGTEDGSVIIFDAHKLIKESNFEILLNRKDHHGHVITIDVSIDGRWMASGGGSGEILLWDMSNLTTPFSPGTANFTNQVKLLRWNQKTESIFTSITSNRASCWDLRRHGSPVLEFAEIGQGCDWSSLTWSPSNASQLILGSQSQNCSLVQKWDLRYTSTPIKEYRHHNFGITSIDWNKKDDRLVVSSGCDAQVIIWNHETGEILGGVGSLQGDWIRSVRWNEVDANQLAIQYFRQPLQIASISSLGEPQPGAEVLAPRIVDTFIPAWLRAPMTGASISLGGKLATYWKSYDILSQKWMHNVEVETIIKDPEVVLDVQEFVHNKENKANLAWYLHDLAYKIEQKTEEDEIKKTIWLFIVAVLDGKSRNKFLQHLGLISEQIDSETTTSELKNGTTSNTVSGHDTTLFSSSSSEVDENPENCGGFIKKATKVNWKKLDENGWDLIKLSIETNHEKVIEALCIKRHWMAALMYAAKNETSLMTAVFEKYKKVENKQNEIENLISTLCSDNNWSSVNEKHDDLENLVEAFPDEKWKILLGILIANEESGTKLEQFAKFIGLKWMRKGYHLRACLAFILAGDIDNFMVANQSFPVDERVKQGISICKAISCSNCGEVFEKVLIEYINGLLKNGLAEMAWKILAEFKEPNCDELVELKHIVYCAAGGRDCTGDAPPRNPWVQENVINNNNNSLLNKKYNPIHSQSPPPPAEYNRRNSSLAPMPPSSMFYQTPSWDHKPPPSMPEIPPSKPAVPIASGWNDPPPLMPKVTTTPRQNNVMQMNWKPLDTPAVPGGMMPNRFGGYAAQNIGTIGGMMQNMSIGQIPISVLNNTALSSAATSALPSPTLHASSSPLVAPTYNLSPEDEIIMKPIENLSQWIIDSSKIQARSEKANELRMRIKNEMEPRLATNRLSAETKTYLKSVSHFAALGQFREAQACLGQMARSSTDFSEISSFLPALKSLFSLALR